MYTLGMGALDKYSDYFNYTTRLYECDNNMKLAEQRYARFEDDYYPSPENWEGTFYDYINGKAVKLADTLRMGTSVAYSCNQGFKEDFYEKVWKDLTNMALTDLIKMWLLHDIAMYNDVLAIIGLTA